jgi:hypothetical protein
MTLIELIISIAVLGILVGPISAMILLGFVSSDGTSNRIADSVSAQVVSSYLVTDVQSADLVQPGVSACAGSGTPFLHLQWNDPKTGGVTDVAYYWTAGNLPDQRQLLRASCGATSSAPALIVQDFDPSPLVSSITCHPSATCGIKQDTVSIKITARNAHPLSSAYYQPFTFAIDAHPRTATT